MNKIFVVTKRSAGTNFDRSICSYVLETDAQTFVKTCETYHDRHPLILNRCTFSPNCKDPRAIDFQRRQWKNSHILQINEWEIAHPIREFVKDIMIHETDTFTILPLELIPASISVVTEPVAETTVDDRNFDCVDGDVVKIIIDDDLVCKGDPRFDENHITTVHGVLDRKIASLFWDNKILELYDKKSIVLYSVFKKIIQKGWEIRYVLDN